ncbi:3-oxoacyl-[acyl-carrier-protein] reductase [Treponema brennaborense]|uniref:3-oxoacyl-[acyl-carrier-protein] reductase n=1 Tax=Treponema brennaborense (strain DSM 12168 / CIP 105900 / DD5/3) TaxID=906968 RepID=F4LQB7_TREBD|nr:3-oxoacyl-[acyl-carrier-protein] reductase [Treponema brennaborense]AEE16138.1 3-oxoacyl-(acyl-carrier-protein) reductase [Treponema brennaborense DSM 12168]
MLLQGKKALVTGSSRGIGKEIARRFLEEGAEVWGLCSKPSAARAELEAYAAEKGSAFHEICADAGNAENLSETVKAALADAGCFDILVNNAGITRDGLSFRMSMDDWQKVLDVNLTGVFIVSQLVSSAMIRKRSGSIINMTSIVGLHGQGGQVNYSASKAGLIGLTKSLAKECGGRGVRVNAIAPGFIDTDMTRAVNEEARKVWLEGIPLKRAGQVSDIANAAVFLASDMSSYITAQVLGVDGGMGA